MIVGHDAEGVRATMNILVVHEVSYAKKVVYEYQEFAERLAARGHRVTVIDYDETGDSAQRERAISRTGTGTVTLRNTPYLNVPVLKYVTGKLNYPKLLATAIAEGRVDVVLLYSVFINGTATVRMCAERGIPVVYRVLDAYHKLRQNPWIAGILHRGERFIYRNVDAICLTNAKMEEYVANVAGQSVRDRTIVIDHGVDTEIFQPRPRDEQLTRQYGILPTDRVALFVGTLYPFAGIGALLERFEDIRDACPTAKIVVVGDGPLMPTLRRVVAKHGLEARVVLTGMRPYDEVPRWLSVADVAFNSFEINDITREIIPIKTLQYLASGRAIVSAPIPDVQRLFPEPTGGIVYGDIADPAAFARLLGRTLADPAGCARLAAAGRTRIEERYSLARTIDALEKLLREQIDLHARNGR